VPTTPDNQQRVGWSLLVALNFLVKLNSQAILDGVCHAALPSTIIKCLYLFYDLPPVDSSDSTGAEHREQLYDVVVEVPEVALAWDLVHVVLLQLMSSLLGSSGAGDELAKKDDLALLFNGISSWCPSHNQRWRRATSQLLLILSSRCLSTTVINYIHCRTYFIQKIWFRLHARICFKAKSCVSTFVENLRRGKDLPAVEVADMVVCLFCVMKDSSSKTRLLLDDLKEADGYGFLVDFILKYASLEHQTNRKFILTPETK